VWYFISPVVADPLSPGHQAMEACLDHLIVYFKEKGIFNRC